MTFDGKWRVKWRWGDWERFTVIVTCTVNICCNCATSMSFEVVNRIRSNSFVSALHIHTCGTAAAGLALTWLAHDVTSNRVAQKINRATPSTLMLTCMWHESCLLWPEWHHVFGVCVISLTSFLAKLLLQKPSESYRVFYWSLDCLGQKLVAWFDPMKLF